MAKIKALEFGKYVEDCRSSLINILNTKNIPVSKKDNLNQLTSKVSLLKNFETSTEEFNLYKNPLWPNYEKILDEDTITEIDGQTIVSKMLLLYPDYVDTSFTVPSMGYAAKFSDSLDDILKLNYTQKTHTWDTTKDIYIEGLNYGLRYIILYITNTKNIEGYKHPNITPHQYRSPLAIWMNNVKGDITLTTANDYNNIRILYCKLKNCKIDTIFLKYTEIYYIDLEESNMPEQRYEGTTSPLINNNYLLRRITITSTSIPVYTFSQYVSPSVDPGLFNIIPTKAVAGTQSTNCFYNEVYYNTYGYTYPPHINAMIIHSLDNTTNYCEYIQEIIKTSSTGPLLEIYYNKTNIDYTPQPKIYIASSSSSNLSKGSFRLLCFNTLSEFNINIRLCTSYYKTGSMSLKSLRQFFYNLKDLTGEESKTVYLSPDSSTMISEEDKAIATNKNWILAF